MSLQLTEHQNRYDECVKNRLTKEYDWLLARCERDSIPVMPDLDPNRNGRDNFIARAHECGYVLGMRPIIVNKDSTANTLNVAFETQNIITIPFGTNPKGVKSRGQIPPRLIQNTNDIAGFGIKLSLAGWRIFLNTKFDILIKKLDEGKSIETIYEELCTPSKVVVYNGETLAFREACRRSGVHYWNFIKAQKDLSKEERQRLFDKMVATKEQFTSIPVYSSDAQILKDYAQRAKTTPADALHDFIQSLDYS